jgi:xanthine dehydrogenase accessory factor
MFDIAATVLAWQQAGRPVVIARLIETVGFSSLDREHVAALSAGAPIAGALLSGVADGQLRAAIAAGTTSRVIDVSVTDDEAATAGLSCGGRARVLLQDATEIEPAAWAALAEREPGCLITRIDAGDRVGSTDFYPAGAIDAAEERYGPGVRRLLARGATQTTMLPGTEWTAAVTVLWPVPSPRRWIQPPRCSAGRRRWSRTPTTPSRHWPVGRSLMRSSC